MQKIIYTLITVASAALISGSDYNISIPKDFGGINKEFILNLSLENMLEIFILIILASIIYASTKKIKANKKKISIHLPFTSFVTLSVLDSYGEEISVIQKEYMNSGNYNFVIDFNTLRNGIYYYQIKAENENKILEKKLKLIVSK
jgi:hypothetical protein